MVLRVKTRPPSISTAPKPDTLGPETANDIHAGNPHRIHAEISNAAPVRSITPFHAALPPTMHDIIATLPRAPASPRRPNHNGFSHAANTAIPAFPCAL